MSKDKDKDKVISVDAHYLNAFMNAAGINGVVVDQRQNKRKHTPKPPIG